MKCLKLNCSYRISDISICEKKELNIKFMTDEEIMKYLINTKE